MTVRTIDDIFRDFVTDGVPASGPFHPYKPDIRDTLKKLLEGISTFPDNRIIRLNNANTGTANNIIVTASVAIPAAAYQVLYILNVTQENTGPVTVSGAVNRALVTNTSAAIPSGYLTPGMAVLCIDTGSELRMLSYGDMEVLIRAAQVEVDKANLARAAAEAARDIAAGYASDAVSQGNVPIYGTIAGMVALEIPSGINTIRVNGASSPHDGLGGKFCDFDTGNGVSFVSGGSTSRNWYRANDSVGSTVWSAGTYRTMRERATDIYCILDAPGAADPSGNNDSTPSIRAMVSSGATCEITRGSFIQTEEIEFTTRNQKIRGQGMGQGYGNGGLAVFQPRSRIIVVGTGQKRLRTRRLYRGSVSDPMDAPLSVAWNIQAAGVNIEDLCLWLDCNYADMSPANLGADWDALLFSGTRLGLQMKNIAVLGYARRAGVLIDVSQASAMPRFSDLNGNEYQSENVRHGSDGIHLWNPYIRGGRQGLAILGARPKDGSNSYSDPYYDIVSGGLVSDDRGGFGCSDFAVFGGSIYGPDHHSGRRLKDPELESGVLSLNGMLSEPDDAPCAVHIDGLAGNGANAVWGMRFYGTRFNTREAFRIRLRKAARVWFFGCHSDVASGLTSTGEPLTTNDYVTQSYGDLAGTVETMRISWQGTVQTGRGSLSPHFYGADLSFHTDQGIVGTDRYVDSKEGVRCTTGHMEVRSATGSNVYLRSGGVALLTASATSVSFAFPARLPTYTVATVPSPTLGGGHLIHVANETGGSTPAFSDGSQWRRVQDRAPIS